MVRRNPKPFRGRCLIQSSRLQLALKSMAMYRAPPREPVEQGGGQTAKKRMDLGVSERLEDTPAGTTPSR